MSSVPEPVRVLHVDGEPDFAAPAAACIERTDDAMTVETATSGDAGLEGLPEGEFDCVVSDLDRAAGGGTRFEFRGVELP